MNLSTGPRYSRLESNIQHRCTNLFMKLVFSFKFIIIVCMTVMLLLFFLLIWGKNIQPRDSDQIALERLDKQKHVGQVVPSEKQRKKPRILRTLAPDVDLAISQCPHAQDPPEALLYSIRMLDNDPACKKALFSAACQLERGLLYETVLPVTCQKDAKIDSLHTDQHRILFVIDVNSGASRQIERLLINIYRNTHYYLLLVPNCYVQTSERLKRIRGLVANVRLLFYDIECPDDAATDISLPQTPETWRVIVENSTGWNWNYMLSLDAYDFPLLNVDKLTRFLENHFGTNFLESYSIDENSDYLKNISTQACADGRRWPIGRGIPPNGLSYFLGPPWYMLSRQFLDYALVSDDDQLVRGLRKYASMTPFPAQLLFHTLAHNGKFCHTFVNESLLLTKYHIFDQRSRAMAPERLSAQEQEQLSSWTFTPKDFVYLANQPTSHSKIQKSITGQKFFGRRFDPTVSQQIILDVESTLDEKSKFHFETPRLHSYWQTIWSYKMQDKRKSTLRYAAVARLLGDLCLKRLKRCTNSVTPKLADLVLIELTLFRDYDLNDGLILSMNITCDGPSTREVIPLECYVTYLHNEKMKQTASEITDLRNDLLHLRVGSDYDIMDNVFRNYAGSVVLDTNENFGLRTQWVQGEMGAQYQFAWIDPKEFVSGTTFANIGPWTSIHFQPKSDDLQYLQSGIWTAALLNEAKVIAATEFLVLPETRKAYEREDIKERLRWAKRFYEVNRICVPNAAAKKLKTCKCGPPSVPSCEVTSWSTLSPDVKSNVALFLKYTSDKRARIR